LLLINKDNAELKAIIENVRAGRAPIEKTQPLETLEALPLTDSDGASTETEDAELAPVE
jgi:hypothetical protein